MVVKEDRIFVIIDNKRIVELSKDGDIVNTVEYDTDLMRFAHGMQVTEQYILVNGGNKAGVIDYKEERIVREVKFKVHSLGLFMSDDLLIYTGRNRVEALNEDHIVLLNNNYTVLYEVPIKTGVYLAEVYNDNLVVYNQGADILLFSPKLRKVIWKDDSGLTANLPVICDDSIILHYEEGLIRKIKFDQSS